MKNQTSTIPPHQFQALWNPAKSYMRILLTDFQVDAHVGLHPWEKFPQRPTRLSVTVEMFAAIGDEKLSSLTPMIDYDIITKTLKSWSAREHTPLLETLVEEVIALCFENEKVEACRVSIVKPDIFNNAASAGVELYRVRPGGEK
jgi:dihydroneopterin aldolase